jgi:cytochrome c oxidase subunit 1
VTEPPAADSRRRLVALLTTTDHKQIGYLYLVAAFGFFLLAG